jgi:hypothetical protein
MTKRELITRITGQDSSYLVELMLSTGYEAHGVIRGASTTARLCGTTPSRTALRRSSSTSPSSPDADWSARIPPDSVKAVAVLRPA